MAVGVIHGADDELGLLLREVMVRVGVGSGYGRHHRRRKQKKNTPKRGWLNLLHIRVQSTISVPFSNGIVVKKKVRTTRPGG
jgi:hypothetical protein